MRSQQDKNSARRRAAIARAPKVTHPASMCSRLAVHVIANGPYEGTRGVLAQRRLYQSVVGLPVFGYLIRILDAPVPGVRLDVHDVLVQVCVPVFEIGVHARHRQYWPGTER